VYALNGSFSLQDINEELLAQLKAAGSTLNARVHLEAGADDRVLRATQDLSNGEIVAVLPEQAFLFKQRISSDPLIKHLIENAGYVCMAYLRSGCFCFDFLCTLAEQWADLSTKLHNTATVGEISLT
jgi:hypothetical protein